MQFRSSKELDSKKLFKYGTAVFIVGVAFSILRDSGSLIIFLAGLMKLLGFVLLLWAVIKRKREKEQLIKENLGKGSPIGKTKEMEQTRKRINMILLALFLITIIAIFYYWFLWNPETERLEDVESTLNTTTDLFEEYRDNLNDYLKEHGLKK